MKDKLIYKIIFSIPVILIMIYLVPVLLIILLIAKQFITKKSWYTIPIILIILSIVIYIPQILDLIFAGFKLESINQVISLNIYEKLLKYGKTLFIIGLLILTLSGIFNKIIENLVNQIKKAYHNYQEKEYQINKENNLKIKEKQLRSNTTNVVICQNCGASNIITEKTGICKYCRTAIENEKSK